MTIDSFSGPHEFLSNFFEHDIICLPVGPWQVSGPTVEHIFQAAKCSSAKDARSVCLAETPGRAKRLGRKFPMRADWNDVRVAVMAECLDQKFVGTLRDKLMNTGDEILIEGNTWGDEFWGVCDSNGENWLGRLLMLKRSRILWGMK